VPLVLFLAARGDGRRRSGLGAVPADAACPADSSRRQTRPRGDLAPHRRPRLVRWVAAPRSGRNRESAAI